MTTDNFYVTLISNVKHKTYDNEACRFLTELSTPLDLKGTWEVGISSIFLPNTFYNVKRKGNEIEFFNAIADIDPKTKRETGTFTKDALQKNNVEPGFYDSAEEIYKSVKKRWHTLWDYHKFVHLTKEKKLKFKLTGSQSLLMGKHISQILGFKNTAFLPRHYSEFPEYDFSKSFIQNNDTTRMYHSDYPVDVNLFNNYVFVYIDIINYSLVGNTSAPLLAVIPWLTTKKLNILAEQYQNPDYVRVSRNYISEIFVEIRDPQGQFINFKTGSVLMKLHFRKVKDLF